MFGMFGISDSGQLSECLSEFGVGSDLENSRSFPFLKLLFWYQKSGFKGKYGSFLPFIFHKFRMLASIPKNACNGLILLIFQAVSVA